ncbi:TlpA family protein disulfide reductase [Sphingobacterium siyangense]|uniref:TlpA family protein disulfide reductase n=1 Tax=Sphingobacterium siyangense TaxID=459529 RepID=UPI003DA2BF9E
MKKIYVYLSWICLSLYLTNGFAQNSEHQKYKVNIKVNYPLNKPGDSLTMFFYPHESVRLQQIAVVDKNGFCSFDLEQEYPFGFFTIDKFKVHKHNDNRGLVYQVYWEKGDNIFIHIKDNPTINDYETGTVFSGQGAEKYTLQYKLRKELNSIYEEVQTKNLISTDSLKYIEQLEARLTKVLNASKNRIAPFIYDVIKTDILMTRYESKIENLTYFKLEYAKGSKIRRMQLTDSIHKMFTTIKQFPVSAEGMAASKVFQKSIGGLYFATALLNNNPPDLTASLDNLDAYFPGIQKESILISFLQKAGFTKDQKELYRIKKTESTFPYNRLFDRFLQLNDRNVLGYTFLDTLGNKVDLRKYAGKYLLIDFWYIGCGGCGVYYLNTLSKIEEEFKNDDRFAVVSISSDPNFNKWKKSIPLNRYTNEQVINLNTGPAGFRHKFAEEIGINIYPFVLLVDPKGNIIEYNTNSIRTTTELLRKTLNKYLN